MANMKERLNSSGLVCEFFYDVFNYDSAVDESSLSADIVACSFEDG